MPRRPGTAPSPTCSCSMAIASFRSPVAWYCWATSRRVRARNRTSVPCLAMSSACKLSASASLLRASKARAPARSNRNCASCGPARFFAGVPLASALSLVICASSGFSLSRMAVISAIVRGGATNEVRISIGTSPAASALGAAGAATPAACFCSSRITQGRTIAAPQACLAFSSSGPATERGLPTLPRTQVRSSSICACLQDSMICSWLAANAGCSEASWGNAATASTAIAQRMRFIPNRKLRRSDMPLPEAGTPVTAGRL